MAGPGMELKLSVLHPACRATPVLRRARVPIRGYWKRDRS